MFPSAGDQVYYNEAGEPLGWDKPEDDPSGAYFCDTCGFSHTGECPDPYDDTDTYDEDSGKDDWSSIDDPEDESEED